MSASAGYIEVPIEVIVKYTEKGDCVPVKMLYGDSLYIIEKVLHEEPPNPARIYGYAPRRFLCIIAGQKRELLFYAHQSKWTICKYVPYHAID